MDPKSKIAKLRSLDEATLREEILAPLLMRMEFKAVTVYHGSKEHGKDLIFFDYDRLGVREYYAVVAKATKLTGDVSSSKGLKAVLFQVEQCFNVPYENLFNMARVTMDRVWVVASDSISTGAEQSIFSQLEKSNLAKLVRFVPVENLVELIDEHLPAYWDDSLEPIDVVKEQKQRLIAFTRQLLLALGGEPSAIAGTLKQVVNSAFPPQVRPASNRWVNTVSPYNVEIDTIDPDHAHDFWSVNYGLLRPLYLKAKQDLYYAMSDFDEILGNYDDVITHTNPAEVARVFDHRMSDEYPFHRASFGRAGEAVQSMQYLDEAAREIEELRKSLQKLGKLEWATSLVDSVADLKPDIQAYITNVTDETFLMCWKIESENDRARLRMLYDPKADDYNAILTTDHQKTIQTSYHEPITTRPITVNDVVERIQEAIRAHFDQLLINAGIIVGEDEKL